MLQHQFERGYLKSISSSGGIRDENCIDADAHDVDVRLFDANGSGADTSKGGRAAENSETSAELSL